MATYTAYNFAMPNNWESYIPQYNTYSYKKPKDEYSDYDSPYGSDIRKAVLKQEQLDNSKPAAFSSAYDNRINQLINEMSGRKFSYDLNNDALFQQYRDNYMQQGKQAMMDTIGQASALTGGYGNSYAAAAGNQAYQAWLGQLNNKIPELYQLALEKYNTEGQDKQRLYSMMASQDASDYGKYRDSVADYQNEVAANDARLQNLRSMAQNLWGQDWNNYLTTAQMSDANRQNAINTALNLYGTDWDNYKWGESQTAANYAQAVAEDQWNANFAENQRQFNESQALANRQLEAKNSAGTTTTANDAENSTSAKPGFYAKTGNYRYADPYEKFTSDQYTNWKNNLGMNRTVEGICAAVDDALNEGKITETQANAALAKYKISAEAFYKARGYSI